jgi:hypothetical protein
MGYSLVTWGGNGVDGATVAAPIGVPPPHPAKSAAATAPAIKPSVRFKWSLLGWGKSNVPLLAGGGNVPPYLNVGTLRFGAAGRKLKLMLVGCIGG